MCAHLNNCELVLSGVCFMTGAGAYLCVLIIDNWLSYPEFFYPVRALVAVRHRSSFAPGG